MRKIILLLALCIIGLASKEQTKSTQNLLLHTSKQTCNAGQVLPFKCYIINSITHIGEDNNLYVILFDKLGNIVFRDKYPVFNSSANGNIKVPKELPSGKYTIGAFTPYMINNKMIKYNQLFIENLETINTNSTIELRTFVNNSLVSNVPNTFFVKTEKNEIPISSKFSIIDKSDKEIQHFFTDANGVAKVTFTPARNQEYSLLIDNKKHLLPRPDSVGVNIQTSFDKNILTFLINKNFKLATANDFFTITAYQNEVEVYKTNFSFDNYSSISAGVNVEALATGVVKIVLHNKDKATICSAYVYLKNPKNFDAASIKSYMNNATNKSIIELNFQQPSTRFLSASISEIESRDSIFNTPFDFFYNRDQNQFPYDDVLNYYEIGSQMQTHKYINLTPSIKSSNEVSVLSKISDEYGVIIKGKVYDPTGQNVLTSGFLNFTSETKDTVYNYSTKVKNDGSFVLDSLFFIGTQKFEYTYLNSSKKEVAAKIKIIQNTNNYILDSLLSSNFKYKIKLTNLVVALKRDTITPVIPQNSNSKKSNEPSNNNYATGVYAGNSNATIDNIKNPPKDGNMSGGTFVKNRIQNTAFQGGNLVNTKNLSMSSSTYWAIGIVIDEMPVTLADLNLLTANDIGIVKFFEPGHVSVSSATPGGIIAIYTKNKILQSNNANAESKATPQNNNIQIFEYTGFTYHINNFLKKVNYQPSPGLFFWNSSIILNKSQTNFSFETEKLEAQKKYRIAIIGYNELGKFINIEKDISN